MSRKISDDELIHMYAKPGRGYTDAGLGEHFGVGREAIYKRRRNLEGKYPFKQTERGRWRIDAEKLISHIAISQNEALVLYLATRRFSRNTPLARRYVKEALDKLAPKLHQPMTEKLVQAAARVPDHPNENKREQILNELMRAWSEKSAVRIKYQSLTREGEGIWHEVSPYLIEPSPWSDSVYLVGYSATTETIIPFSLERIEKAMLTRAPFKECDPATEEKLLEYAWGIWRSDQKAEKVQLRFTGRTAVRRLRESIWHPKQEIDGPDDYSYAVWEAPIAEWREMVPWIRGWGADVEVIKPQKLKDAIYTDVQRLNRIYNIETKQPKSLLSRLLRCWGKTGNEDWNFHPALFHMFDVGHVAQQLLNSPASPRWRRVLSKALNAEPETLVNWLPWFIAMHDIGKISVPFQAQNADQKSRLEAEGFAFGRWKSKDQLYHTYVGQIFLKNELPDISLPRRLLRAWQEVIGGHHGIFAEESLGSVMRTLSYIQEPEEWKQLRAKACQILQGYLLHQIPPQWPEPTNISAAIMALTGFTILCDWLGSDSRFFSPQPYTDLFDYILISRQCAHKAVAEAEFFQPGYSDVPTPFEQLFPHCVPARPLQQAIDAIPANVLSQPCLAIIEAPTGEGKTEAALALAHRLAQSQGTDEFYCALPTTATSNQMFIRIQEHLRDRLNLDTEANLVHSQAFLIKDDLQIEPLSNGDGEPKAALEWFSPKKRALLAPFGVGTVDQAELAALNVRHNALRLIGLAGKVVILDEVHAYDTYMTTIIEQMLRWLSALGSSVILLSATLPLSRRTALTQAYGAEMDSRPDKQDAYPSLWVGGQVGVYHVTPAAYQPQRQFYISPLHIPHDDVKAKAEWLLAAIADGGCACWITNTVDRAQQLTQAIMELDQTVDCILLHARFPLEDRQRLERQIRKKYGPGGERPERSVVIGTQVLEQSLDLDFDLMVSDLAPIDLLLQRMGRLHRHRNKRPYAHQFPHLWVNCELDPEQSDLVKMGADRFYPEYILQKTWQAIARLTHITLPVDYRPLVEAVYSSDEPSPDDPLFAAWEKLKKQEINALGEARLRLLPDPNPRRPFCDNNQITFAEDEDSAAWIVAQTRLGPETIMLIPLEREGDQARLIPTDQTVDLSVAPPREIELKLLRRSLRLSQWHVVQYFKQLERPQEPLFKQSALLKSVYPLWLTDGQTTLTFENVSVTLTLDSKLGLLIEREHI